MARYTVLSETNNIDTNWSTFLTLLRDLEHRFIPTKTINLNGKRRNSFPIDKKTRDLIKRKNTQGLIYEWYLCLAILLFPRMLI
jgi:hypothetical protein